jgi:hypothetical protein
MKRRGWRVALTVATLGLTLVVAPWRSMWLLSGSKNFNRPNT